MRIVHNYLSFPGMTVESKKLDHPIKSDDDYLLLFGLRLRKAFRFRESF